MSLSPGSSLGNYEVVGLLGAGGMGEVYRARDPRLGREVAIKSLPPAFARDPERLARFEREARALASLNHPNIASIYGLEEIEGARYLILELVEGDGLDQRIDAGPIAPRETLEIAMQIATALEAAHEGGVIHRDLKPANVKLTQSGEVKVLDFGLAKGNPAADSSSSLNLSQTPTITLAATGEGTILGTAAYMSPEQARGKSVDRRTDIWSFGCVVYECLTGEKLFEGETTSDLIARILEREPDWSRLPEGTPARLRTLLQRCLEKDAKRRLRDIGDARIEIEGILAEYSSSFRPQAEAKLRASRSLVPMLGWAAALVFAVVAVFLYLRGGGAPAPEGAVRFAVQSPPGITLPGQSLDLALSPDGSRLAFVAFDSSGTGAIWLRNMESMEPTVLAGTENGSLPFWSPDGRSLGFFADGKLKRIPAEGGRAEVLADANNGRGGTWSKSGVIVFGPAGGGPLYKVSERGGEVTQVTVIDTLRKESAHRFPCFLPDGKRFTYAALPPKQSKHEIFVGSVDGGPGQLLMEAESAPIYAPPGFLIFRRGVSLAAQRFQAGSLQLQGEAFALNDAPAPNNTVSGPGFTVSASGALAYISGGQPNTQLVWVNRAGERTGTVSAPPGRDLGIVLSPDGSRLATIRVSSSLEADIWILEMERGTLRRFTFGGGDYSNPVWSPDGRELVYESNKSGRWDIYRKSLAGSGEEELLHKSDEQFKHPTFWSRDGRTLLFEVLDETTGWDIWTLDLESKTARPFLATPFNEQQASLSSDGAWMVHMSDESGRPEIYVQSFPALDRKYQITNGGGFGGGWNKANTEMLMAGGDGISLQVVATTFTPDFHASLPRTLFQIPQGLTGLGVTPDFSRFLMSIPEDGGASTSLRVVLNWQELLPAQ